MRGYAVSPRFNSVAEDEEGLGAEFNSLLNVSAFSVLSRLVALWKIRRSSSSFRLHE
jgi:hypothetical protein